LHRANQSIAFLKRKVRTAQSITLPNGKVHLWNR